MPTSFGFGFIKKNCNFLTRKIDVLLKIAHKEHFQNIHQEEIMSF